jgi:hypothetical protein
MRRNGSLLDAYFSGKNIVTGKKRMTERKNPVYTKCEKTPHHRIG